MDGYEGTHGWTSGKVGLGPGKKHRCNPRQLELLRECSRNKDSTKWNKWRQDNPREEIWLEGANLRDAYLEGADLFFAHMEGADLHGTHLARVNLSGAHLEGARLVSANLGGAKLGLAHLEGANLGLARLEGATLAGAYLERADFIASLVDGPAPSWRLSVDRKTDFRGVGLESCRIDEETKYLLECNRRRMSCQDLSKKHPQLARPIKAFFWISDYGNSTRRIVGTFFVVALCFALIYYVWGAVDYHLLGMTNRPGVVAHLFVDPQGPVAWWWVPLRSLYLSIVTLTTLGFGDTLAKGQAISGDLLLMLQALLGYVFLGALVVRFAVLFKSGAIPRKFKKERQEPQKWAASKVSQRLEAG